MLSPSYRDIPKNKTTIILLFSFTFLIIIGKCVMLSNIRFDLDKLISEVNPVRDKISDTTSVGFDSNINEQEKYTLFLAVKNIMAPKILKYQRDLDTLLLIQSRSYPPLLPNNYHVILKSENHDAIVLLVTKVK